MKRPKTTEKRISIDDDDEMEEKSIDDGDDISMNSNDNDDDDDDNTRGEHWNRTNEKETETEIHDDGVEIEKAQQMIVVDDRDSLELANLDWNLSHVCSSFDDDCDQLNWKVRLCCGSVDVDCCPVTTVSSEPNCSRHDSILL